MKTGLRIAQLLLAVAQLVAAATPPQRVDLGLVGADVGYAAAEPNASAVLRGRLRGAVEMFDVDTVVKSMLNRPGRRIARQQFDVALPDSAGTTWLTIDLDSSFTAYMRRVYLSVSLSACRAVYMLATPQPSEQQHALANLMSRCQEDAVWIVDSSSLAYSIRAHGTNASSLPPDWHCSDSAYRDDKCDCLCGAWDPACATAPASNCPSGWVCDKMGECLDPAWPSCDERGYDASDGCDCDCGGLVDPDCVENAENPRHCEGLNMPFCYFGVGSGGGHCQDRWTCNMSRYGDSKVCDCECGEKSDPDCTDASLPTSCDGNWFCQNTQCTAPREWVCNIVEYNNGLICDCDCGAFDPDCDLSPINTCQKGTHFCNTSGMCAPYVCGNHLLENTTDHPEECDGGLGCSSNCTCMPGYAPSNHLSTSCAPKCGDGEVVEGEQCDSGRFCTNCRCDAGHAPYSPAIGSCYGCGNDVLDENESCDSHSPGCEDCRCVGDYRARAPHNLTCEHVGDNKKVIITATVPCAAAVVLVSIIATAIYLGRKAKNAPRKLNIPVELNMGSADKFVATEAYLYNSGGMQLSPSSSGGSTPVDMSSVLCSTASGPHAAAQQQPLDNQLAMQVQSGGVCSPVGEESPVVGVLQASTANEPPSEVRSLPSSAPYSSPDTGAREVHSYGAK
eukprot:m51a1_g7548 putative serine-threonine protein (675) ;mRNA; f:82719-85341